jgi:hypothetical protein
MKLGLTVLTAMLFAGIVYAQDPPQTATGSTQDSIQIGKNAPDRAMYSHEKRLFQGHGFNFRPGMMQPGCNVPEFAGMEKGNCPMWGPSRFMHHHHACCGYAFFKLLLLGFILINILLTIIVSLDMARIGRFNGLWIPVVLLAGIPGSIIYALFRIGDRIPCKSST